MMDADGRIDPAMMLAGHERPICRRSADLGDQAASVTAGATESHVAAAGLAAALVGSKMSDWTRMGEKDLKELQSALGRRRVVVFIDDIDRADPRAVPKTLLALRELMDWPGFAYVLAFDKEVVTRALSEYSKAYGESADRQELARWLPVNPRQSKLVARKLEIPA